VTQQLQRLADRITDTAGTAMAQRTSRRGLLVKATIVGSALTLAPPHSAGICLGV
jgi:hypothetical protein